MNPLAFELLMILLAYAALFAAAAGGCWWGLRKLGPEEGDDG